MLRKPVMMATVALLLAFAASAKEQAEPRTPGFRWIADFDAAIREAKDRNIPLMVSLHKDH